MKLLVTGGAGYVGSVCARVLIEHGHDVTIIDNLSTGNVDALPDHAAVSYTHLTLPTICSV